jgi:penicillin-binding protein 2
MQLARAFAVLANKGQPVVPHLMAAPTEPLPHEQIDPHHLSLVEEALVEVVHGAAGTARRIARVPMAGKTGTAQVVRLMEGVDADELAPELRHHALFVGWAPLEEPELVVAVIVEHGGDGGSVAAPVAARVVEAHLQRLTATVETPPPPPPEKTPDDPIQHEGAG